MKKLIVISFMLVSVLFAVNDSHHAAAKPISDEVEICHRTYSVEKPYVRIIVAQSSIGSGHGKHGGESHDEYSQILFPQGKPSPNVFNMEMVYEPASEKLWGDIIPLTDVSGNKLIDEAADFAGMNYIDEGRAIYDGIGDYAGLCASSSTDEDATTTTSTVADSTTTTSTVADSTTTTSTVADSTTTTSTVAIFATTTTVASSSTTAPTNSPTTPSTSIAPSLSAIKEPVPEILERSNGKLKGHLWIDANRNELDDRDEESIHLAVITVRAAPGNSSVSTYSIFTDVNGNYLVNSIEPGKWLVESTTLLGDNYENVTLNKFVKASSLEELTVTVVSLETAEADFAYATKVSTQSKIIASAETKPQVDALPITGSGNSRSLLVIAVLLMMIGSIVIKRDVK
jgi:hypothetical protein